MKRGEGWRKEGAERFDALRGGHERHISPNAHQTFSTACGEDPVPTKRPGRDDGDALIQDFTGGQRWRFF
ncbi:hypothetical protein FQA47_001981 [Oryzias melastigma]|uniref:Uncharacterized protein n=1 Tax=Oryzias melastigma TaxID=30732 RepID=A0A834CCM6_ORYME|nr:hypothetical protein FQA47_001981 [Oryzias melastigma]